MSSVDFTGRIVGSDARLACSGQSESLELSSVIALISIERISLSVGSRPDGSRLVPKEALLPMGRALEFWLDVGVRGISSNSRR